MRVGLVTLRQAGWSQRDNCHLRFGVLNQESHRPPGLGFRFRNPMGHRMAKGDKSEDSIKEGLIAQSRIAGALNCIILRLMKYSGYVRLSVYEDKYGQI